MNDCDNCKTKNGRQSNLVILASEFGDEGQALEPMAEERPCGGDSWPSRQSYIPMQSEKRRIGSWKLGRKTTGDFWWKRLVLLDTKSTLRINGTLRQRHLVDIDALSIWKPNRLRLGRFERKIPRVGQCPTLPIPVLSCGMGGKCLLEGILKRTSQWGRRRQRRRRRHHDKRLGCRLGRCRNSCKAPTWKRWCKRFRRRWLRFISWTLPDEGDGRLN